MSPSSADAGALPDPFDALEQLQQALTGAPGARQALERVLGAVLEVFDADRAWLLYPCSTDTSTFTLPVERTRVNWPGAGHTREAIVNDSYYRAIIEKCLSTDGPVRFDVEENPLNAESSLVRQYGVRTMLIMSLQPEGNAPWAFGIHHCEKGRNYGPDLRLFRAVAGRVQDCLSRHLVRERLTRSESRFRVLVEHAPEAIVLLDAVSGRFVDTNPNAERLFGMTRQELLKRGPIDFSPEYQPDGSKSSELAMSHIKTALDGGFPIFEWMHFDARGNELECEVRLARLPDSTWVRGSVTHIARRKAEERERLQLQEQLAQAQKLEAIGQLTGGIAHDFNNLLTVILGNLELLVDDAEDPDEVRSQARHIQAAAERACALTHRLLAFARRQPLRPTSLDVRELVHGMDEMLRRTLGENIEIEVVIGGGLWRCEADLAQLESALLNLAINARDAMPDGGRLTIEASNARLDHEYSSRHQEVVPGQYVLLAVSDNGTGIAPEHLEDIFNPFFTTKKMGKGSGLGLSMIFGFAKQSGGHLKVYSELGQGTTMKLYLPRSQSDAVEALPATHVQGQPLSSGERILVVEDDDMVRTLTVRQLIQLGYEVCSASGMQAALDVLRMNDPVHLLLTDVILAGGGSGPELAKAARDLRPEMKVLYMSGYTENSIVHNGRLDAGVELLEKPFDRATLARRVRLALRDDE